MSNGLAVADSKVILMLSLAKLRKVCVTEQFAKYVVILVNEDIFDVPLLKLIGMLLSIKFLKAWIDMNNKSKSDEISSAATLDGSNFSTRKLVPRKLKVERCVGR